MGEGLEATSDFENGVVGVMVGVLSCFCLIILIILCAKKDKQSKDDIGFENLEAQPQIGSGKSSKESHVNGRKRSGEGDVESPTESHNSMETNGKGSKKNKSKKGKKESKKEKKKNSGSKKNDKDNRISKVSQNSKRASGTNGSDGEEDDNADVHDYQELIQRPDPKKPIEISKLKTCIEDIREDPYGFKNEYEMLPDGKQYERSDALRPGLERKNRFHNILPYNHSRVVLEVFNDDPLTDYINASYVDGFKKEKAFIASQGPTAETIPDFWRMVWQEKSSVIVMVTRLVEAGMQKCRQYWPDQLHETVQYGPISVTFLTLALWPDYIVRSFKMSWNGQERFIKQYHFMGWPDHGVPMHATALLNFIRKVKSEIKMTDSPCVVHCSAGVGRSGTFIALDNLLEQAEAESVVDIVDCVSKLRNKRCYMVQTVDQYVFVYNAVLEVIMLGETTIPCYLFQEKYKALTDKDSKTNSSRLEDQFKVLEMMKIPLREEDISFARHEENVSKNRDPNIIPPNRHGVRLMTEIPGRNNYINAAFVDGYMGGTLFIATQMPLPNTIADFYRMMYDYKCKIIIMLNTVDPNNQAEPPYWPKDGESTSFAPFKVEHLKTESSNEFTLRTINLNFKNEDRNVLQLSVNKALNLEDGNELTKSVFFQLFNKLTQLQRNNASRIPVIVHSLKGVELTGVFIALCCLCDMINTEQEVDVFRVVKHIRQTRPQFVPTLAQYNFLYQAAMSYMKQFEDYSNFL